MRRKILEKKEKNNADGRQPLNCHGCSGVFA